MMKSVTIFVVFLASFLCDNLWAAPPTVKELRKPVVEHTETATKQEADDVPDTTKEEATTILQQIIRGISEGDYAMFNRHFSKVMKATQPRENFLLLQKGIQKSLGKFKSLDYLGYYVQGGNRIALFKARFSKEKDDVLVRLVLDAKGPEAKVSGLWFDAPSLEK